jgi:hypothetical protein
MVVCLPLLVCVPPTSRDYLGAEGFILHGRVADHGHHLVLILLVVSMVLTVVTVLSFRSRHALVAIVGLIVEIGSAITTEAVTIAELVRILIIFLLFIDLFES